jgi:hypothetical protein
MEPQRPSRNIAKLQETAASSLPWFIQEANIRGYTGQRSQDSSHLLQGPRLQEAHPTQSYTIQSRQSEHWSPSATLAISPDINLLGLIIRPRKAKIRSQAVRIWWSDETRVQKEGKDNQEGRVEVGVHSMQDKGTASAEAMQAF